MIKKSHVSKLFLVSLLICYLYILLALYAVITISPPTFDTDHSEKIWAAVELSYVRMTIVAFMIFGYPIILFSSLKYAKHATIALTAWAIAMYIDDHLVLYKMIEYPKGVLVSATLLLRPLLIICLIWMSFELTYSKSKVE
jgi:hypothetical protein